MLKAKRREQSEQRKFPEPRLGLPEDPTPFMGSQHLAAAAALQQVLTARCLVAVVGRLGAGKSTVCRRAANSRWARQWFLQDEGGQPVHRRFWVDLEDCRPGLETREKVAAAVGRPSFEEAVARLGNGRPSLLILDNADSALLGTGQDGSSDDATLAELVDCANRGASVIVTRRRVADLDLGRRWTEVIDVSGFGSQDEGRQLFDHLAPRHAGDLRADDVVAACDRLPLAVALVAVTAAAADLEAARRKVGTAGGVEFALSVTAATVGDEERAVWAALSHLPSGLLSDDIEAVVSWISDAAQRTIRLYDIGLVRRCEAGVRVPVALRLNEPPPGDLWVSYVRRAGAVTEPMGWPASGRAGPGRAGGVAPGRGDRSAADRWLKRQVATLRGVADLEHLPDGAFDLALAGLRVHQSGLEPDTLDALLVRVAARSIGSSPDSAHLAATADLAATLEEERRFGTAERLASILIDTHRGNGDPAAEAASLCQLGRTERQHGRYDEAAIHLTGARSLSDQLGDGVGAGSALFELGQVDLDQGRLDEAEAHLGESRSLFAANERPIGEANANLELVRIDLARGRLAHAEERLVVAIDRFDQAGHKLGSANACLQLGQLELARGHLDGAEGRFRAALDGYEQAADKVGFANACLQLGQVDLGRGRLASAERFFGGALAGYGRVGDQVGRANAALQLGQIDLARNRLDAAATRLGEARHAYEQLGDLIGLANASLQLSQVHLARGELAEAGQRLGVAQSAYDDIGDRLGSANSRHIEGLLLHAQGQPTAAMATFAEAARLYALLGRAASAGWSLAAAANASTGRAERAGYAADAVRFLAEAGLGEAAVRVQAELEALPPPAPPPAPLPAPVRGASPAMPSVAGAAVEAAEPEPAVAEPLSSPWPRQPGPAVDVSPREEPVPPVPAGVVVAPVPPVVPVPAGVVVAPVEPVPAGVVVAPVEPVVPVPAGVVVAPVPPVVPVPAVEGAVPEEPGPAPAPTGGALKAGSSAPSGGSVDVRSAAAALFAPGRIGGAVESVARPATPGPTEPPAPAQPAAVTPSVPDRVPDPEPEPAPGLGVFPPAGPDEDDDRQWRPPDAQGDPASMVEPFEGPLERQVAWPEDAPVEDKAVRKPRFRLVRKGKRPDDPEHPTLPGF